MGKGTRNRQVRTTDVEVSTTRRVASKEDKQKRSVFFATLAMGVFVLVLVVSLLANSLIGAGVFMRVRTAAESDDFEVDGTMMSYFVNSMYSNYMSNWMTYVQQLGVDSSQVQSYAYMFAGIDPNTSLKKQVMDTESGQTYFQYFAEQAKAYVEELLIYCQAAKAAGVELDEDDKASIDATIENMKALATYYGYSFNSYLNEQYGRGVREKDVRRALELGTLYSKYATQLSEEFYDASTDEKVNAFFSANEKTYINADYLAYTLTVKKDTAASTEEDKAQADSDYTALKAEKDAIAAELAALKTPDEFKAYIKDLWIEENRESYTEKNYDTYLTESKAETDEEKAEEATQKVEDKLSEDADAYIDGLLTENYAYNEDATDKAVDLRDWIFGKADKAAAMVNTTLTLTAETDSNSDDDKDSYTITVYMLTRAASKNEDTTRNFSYMMMSSSALKKVDADAAFENFKAGEISKETLEALATSDAYKEKASFDTVEDIKEGSLGLADVDEWVYDEAREVGDCELITVTYNEVVYYMIVLFEGIGQQEWYVDTRDGMVSDEIETWYEEQTQTYGVTVNDRVINKVPM